MPTVTALNSPFTIAFESRHTAKSVTSVKILTKEDKTTLHAADFEKSTCIPQSVAAGFQEALRAQALIPASQYK